MDGRFLMELVTMYLMAMPQLAAFALGGWAVSAVAGKLRCPPLPRAALAASVVALGTPCLFGAHGYGVLPVSAAVLDDTPGSLWLPPALVSVAVVWLGAFLLVLRQARGDIAPSLPPLE
jgi:hypothetical protein